jgi:hypothetical protein
VSDAALRCVALAEEPRAIVRRHLADPGSRWSVGTYGAIGEFDYEAAEAGLTLDLERLSVGTPRGSLAIADLTDVRAFALIDTRERVREVAFCMKRPGAQRAAVTALDALTWDLGVAAPHVDLLVRVTAGDTATAAALGGAEGQSLFAAGHGAGAAIARASPTRILVSAVARLEVYQPIPPPGGRSPDGPHTHLLPHLLAQGRTRAPHSPLPDGLYCGLSLYPPA